MEKPNNNDEVTEYLNQKWRESNERIDNLQMKVTMLIDAHTAVQFNRSFSEDELSDFLSVYPNLSNCIIEYRKNRITTRDVFNALNEEYAKERSEFVTEVIGMDNKDKDSWDAIKAANDSEITKLQ